MKRIITFLLALSYLLDASAQTPQAVCYQGVATDQQGRELISQNIRVRLSILKTSAAGAEEWIESHSVTTDGFGLFDLPIGNGTRTGGAQTSFSNIKWGADKYFLKVEMDITGGSNYVLMGVNQLISVPYALYSDKTGVADSAVASSRSLTAITAITANTANYATTSGYSATAGRADTAKFAWLADSARRAAYAYNAGYALTAGRSDTAKFAWLADSTRRAAYAYNAGRSDTAKFAWLADSTRRAAYAYNAGRSDTAKFAWLADSTRRAAYAYNAGRSDTAKFAWLADSTRRAAYAYNAGRSDTAKFAWLADSSRRSALANRATVADSAIRADRAVVSDRSTFASQASFAFLADSSRRAFQAQQALTALDDRDRDPVNEIQTMSFDTASSTLKLTKPNGQFDLINFNGTPLRAPGASIDYPYGILGEAILITSNYTVPNGKTLFISAANNPIILADGRRLNIEPGMPILPSGESISTCFCSGILVKTEPYAQPIILDFAATNFSYTVPDGKTFVIKSGTNDSRDMSFMMGGTNYSFYTGSSASPRLVVIPEKTIMRRGLTNVGTSFMVTGYLLNKTP